MFRWLIHWILSATALLIVSRVVPGFYIYSLGTAMVAALVIGLLNATFGIALKVITFPLVIVTFGLFLLVINALMIMFAGRIVDGFDVHGWIPALWGAVVLSVLNMIIRFAMSE
ncbi:MAG TPA: phage holin family protein [Terracidiphilus sp.]|nr:phage holin family protein [Terracidiphilus sp.]